MLINNSYVAGFQEKAAAAVYSAFRTIPATMVDVLRAAAIGVFGWIREINMTFWEPVRVRHVHAWSRRK